MAVGDFLSGLNLAPEHVANLTTMIGPPAAPVDPYGAPTPEEMARYGATPSDIQVAQNANAPAAAGVSVAAPSRDVAWTPEVDKKRDAEGKQATALAGATPQGPAGSDGFPTYRDLNNTGSAMPSAPMAPGRMVPGGWQLGTRSESRAYGFNPDELQSGEYHRDVAAGQRLLAGDKNLQAEQMRADTSAALAQARVDAEKRAAAQSALIQQQKDAYIMREQEKLDGLNLAASEKVDPEAAKGPAGAQLMATIAIALGQFGASLNGGPNTALQMVNADIDRRIAAQRDNITNAGKARDREQSLYAQNLATFGDKERSALATKMQYLDQVKAMADQQYAGAQKVMNEGQYHAFVAGVNEERAKAADNFAKLTHTQVNAQSNEHYVPAHMVGGAGAGGEKGKEALYVPMLGGYARTKEEAEKLRAKTAMMATINEQSHKIYTLLEEAKGLSSITDYGRMQEIRKEIDAAKHASLVAVTVAGGQGAISKDDKVITEARTALENVDPQLKTTAQIERQRKVLKSVVESNMTETRLLKEGSGIQLGQERYVSGPHGPEARAVLSGQNATVTKKSESVDDLIEKPKGEVKK